MAVWAAVVTLVLAVLVASLFYTERSSFCSTCHEMEPYHRAWIAGSHSGHAECVDCHVDAGWVAHLAHKPIALKEVWDHFFTVNRFPRYAVDVPDSRCVRCHPTVPDKIGALFSHRLHEKKGSCQECHAQTGHAVTLASLAAAGVLKSQVATPAPGGMRPSIAAGHKKVICQGCHDQARMRCSACHQSPHENRGECSDCHVTGLKFVAGHPHRTDCASCHTAPTRHFGAKCASCHTPTVPFAKTVYTHAIGSACATCHQPPSNHFGTGCSRCHKPSIPFASTQLQHPAVHHGYRSRACSKCHPNGYSTAYCTCHNGHPPGA